MTVKPGFNRTPLLDAEYLRDEIR